MQHNTANGELPASCFISLPQHDAHRHAVRLPVRRTVTVGDVAMPAEQTCENVVAALDAVVGRWVSQRLGGVKVCTPSMLPWHTHTLPRHTHTPSASTAVHNHTNTLFHTLADAHTRSSAKDVHAHGHSDINVHGHTHTHTHVNTHKCTQTPPH